MTNGQVFSLVRMSEIGYFLVSSLSVASVLFVRDVDLRVVLVDHLLCIAKRDTDRIWPSPLEVSIRL